MAEKRHSTFHAGRENWYGRFDIAPLDEEGEVVRRRRDEGVTQKSKHTFEDKNTLRTKQELLSGLKVKGEGREEILRYLKIRLLGLGEEIDRLRGLAGGKEEKKAARLASSEAGEILRNLEYLFSDAEAAFENLLDLFEKVDYSDKDLPKALDGYLSKYTLIKEKLVEQREILMKRLVGVGAGERMAEMLGKVLREPETREKTQDVIVLAKERRRRAAEGIEKFSLLPQEEQRIKETSYFKFLVSSLRAAQAQKGEDLSSLQVDMERLYGSMPLSDEGKAAALIWRMIKKGIRQEGETSAKVE